MFRIGEFSVIAQVSGRLLRYYDEIGLFRPEQTDPNTGYRSYSARQLPRLNRILVLKELGLSLEQIATLLDQNTSPDVIRGMLSLRKAQIEQSLHAEMERLRVVETRLHQIETSGQIHEPDVVVKSLPAQHFLALREVYPGFPAVRQCVQKIATFVPAAVGQNTLGHITVTLHSPQFDPDALDLEIGYVLTGRTPNTLTLSDSRTLTVRDLPSVETMATLVHVGQVEDVHRTYAVLGVWVERNGWQVIGQPREVLMQLPLNGSEAVIEVQLPVNTLRRP